MKKGIYFSGLIILIITFLINFPKTNANNYNSKISYDTIKFKGLGEIPANCLQFSDKYYKRFGIVISNYYQVRDSLAISLNNDKYIDTIVILSPLSLEPIDENCDFSFDKHPKRLLVEIINNNGKSKIRNIYPNLVSDIGGVLSHYNGIFKTKEGFKINHEAGARYSWEYSVRLSVGKDSLTLTSIFKKCSYNGKDKNISYHYNNAPISKINIPDTIKNQCNCDEFWSKLDK